jgi:hypothetical protein
MKYTIIFLMLCSLLCEGNNQEIPISKEETQKIGKKIWQNECKGTIEGLTFWSPSEEFPSLGIGHFIWYPNSYNGPFTQTFPLLLQFLIEKKAAVPDWLKNASYCPWQNRNAFIQDTRGDRMQQLRQLLVTTIDLQTEFIVKRLYEALPKMTTNLAPEKQKSIEEQFYRIAKAPGGLYALIDYLNFKGEGTNPKERYHGHGWGLLQILENMKGKDSGPEALKEFSTAAEFVLQRRIQNSPAERNEQQWLPGWKKRLESYLNN